MKKPGEMGKIARPMCSHEAAAQAPALGRPWPSQHEWRDLVRRLAKNPVAGADGEAGLPETP